MGMGMGMGMTMGIGMGMGMGMAMGRLTQAEFTITTVVTARGGVR